MRISLLKTKMKEIGESLDLIEEYLPDDREEFLLLGIIKDGIYKRLEFCIENVFDGTV